MTPLLVTKLYRPPPRPDLVARPGLITHLDGVLVAGCRLGLVCAPAGFGKTTLVSTWVEACDAPVTWLSLDAGDDEPGRFWTYVAAALESLGEGVGDAVIAGLSSPHPSPIEPLLVGLLNRLSRVAGPAVLVLDDYHVISDTAIHEALVFLVEHLPPQLHVVLISRANPPWPLARLRGRGEMVELRTADLRFTEAETAAFLREVMGLPLSRAAITALDDRTEGWPVSLRLAALSMRQLDDPETFVRTLSASQRFVLDYLTEEVVARQPPNVASFLLRTSILDRMSAPLCDAVTGGSDGAQLLSHLEASNLFLVPLDDVRRWYRYHHLFGDLLRNRLRAEHAAEVPHLHERASAWYEAAGLVPEAFRHALAAGAVTRAAGIVETHMMEIMDYGQLKVLTEWLDALPRSVTRERPWLCLARAWVLVYTGEPDRATEFVTCAAALQAEYEQGGRASEARHIAGHLAIIRAYQVAYRRDFAASAELAAEALGLLPPEDMTTRCFAALMRSAMLRRQGKLDLAAEALGDVLRQMPRHATGHTAVMARANLGILYGVQGRLHAAAAIFEEILSDARASGTRRDDQPPPATLGLAYQGLAEIRREWNDLEVAQHLAREGVRWGEAWGSVDMLSGAYYELARVLQAVGDGAGMRQALTEALTLARTKMPDMVPMVEAEAAEVLLLYGDVDASVQWAESSALAATDEFPFQERRTYLALARALWAAGRLDDAHSLLLALLEQVTDVGALTDRISVLVVLALVLDAEGDGKAAGECLSQAVALGAPEGFTRVFLDPGDSIVRLLKRIRVGGDAHVEHLLSATRQAVSAEAAAAPPAAAATVAAQDGLIEPLSDRELEVLRLLTSSLTTTEMASRLYVSVNTVRTHVRHIYEKLGVHRRMDAIDRAGELGLL